MSDGGFCHYCQKVNCICAKSEYLLGFEDCREQAAKVAAVKCAEIQHARDLLTDERTRARLKVAAEFVSEVEENVRALKPLEK